MVVREKEKPQKAAERVPHGVIASHHTEPSVGCVVLAGKRERSIKASGQSSPSEERRLSVVAEGCPILASTSLFQLEHHHSQKGRGAGLLSMRAKALRGCEVAFRSGCLIAVLGEVEGGCVAAIEANMRESRRRAHSRPR